MTIIGFIPGPSCVTATAPDDRPTRFCFNCGCRKRLPHYWQILTDPPERQPSYYEPVPVLRCSRCGEDHASFPGCEIDGPRYPSEAVAEALQKQHAKTVRSWDWDAIWARDRAEREDPA